MTSTFGRPPDRNPVGGFTLVELLVVMLVMGVVASSIVALVVTVGRTSVTYLQVQEDLRQARIGLDTVRRDLRGAHRVLDDADPRCLRVWTDRNRDGRVQADEVVTYELVERNGGRELVRTVGTNPVGSRTVARNLVDEDIFGYEPGPPPGTSLIIVRLEVDARGLAERQSFADETQVRLRNVLD